MDIQNYYNQKCKCGHTRWSHNHEFCTVVDYKTKKHCQCEEFNRKVSS